MYWANIIKIADEFGEEEGDSLFRQIEHAIQLVLEYQESLETMNLGASLPAKVVDAVAEAEENIDKLREYVEDLLRGEE